MFNFKIGNRSIGNGAPCFIIAEAGVNHNGDIELARKLVDIAKEAGSDAVKFQTFKAERIVTKDAKKAAYQMQTTGSSQSQYEMIKGLELNEDDFKSLAAYSKRKDILFLSSPFDLESINILSEIGVPAFKIASGEITNFPLIREISQRGMPVILSTGMADLGEIEAALQVIRSVGLQEIVLLHCVSSYPTSACDVNLRAMETLRSAFKLPVGFSDHTCGIAASIASVAMGACVLEKHFTADKDLPGPDHKASLGPSELKEMVRCVRYTERILGDGIKKPTKEELETRKAVRKSIVAACDLPIGICLQENMLDIKRPGTGIAPEQMHALVGRRIKAEIKKDEIITWDKME